jgi:DNA-binding transcriptional LysR family regulator
MPLPALQWDDLRIVLAIVEQGTLSAAAQCLHVSHPTLSRRLQRIERRLGTQLFERLPTRLNPTPAAEEVRLLALRLRDEIAALERRIGGLDGRADAPVRLTAPDAVAEYLLPDLLAKLCGAPDGLRLELLVSNQLLSLARREADIALRITARPDDALAGLGGVRCGPGLQRPRCVDREACERRCDPAARQHAARRRQGGARRHRAGPVALLHWGVAARADAPG